MLEWIEEQFVPVLENQPSMITLDLFGGHKTDDVLDTLKAHDITVSVIPGGCTSLIQPLDISINRPFKDILKVRSRYSVLEFH
jgi:DDE superfamily endonuclease